MKAVLAALVLILFSPPSHATGDFRCSDFLSTDARAQSYFGAGAIAAYAAVAAKHADFRSKYFAALKELPSANPAVRPETREERTSLTMAWNDHKKFERALVRATDTSGDEVAAALRRICTADPDHPLFAAVLRLLEERTEGLL